MLRWRAGLAGWYPQLCTRDRWSGLAPLGHAPDPREAGYLVYAPQTGTLYAVDERKTDGRGPVHPPASVHALAVAGDTGRLRWLNARGTPGPRPTFLDQRDGRLVCADHGDFQHVEQVVRQPDGGWATRFVYDDSTVILFDLDEDGRVGPIRDLKVLEGHGTDPNGSPQNGGHAQASPHAHCAVIDPSGTWVLVADKGTDTILVYRLGDGLELAQRCRFAPQTAPRHIAFDPRSGLAFATLELSSQIASMRFDAASGTLEVLDCIATVRAGHAGGNEPAEIRVHPHGRFVYVNNRGEDTLAWFGYDSDGRLARLGDVPLAPSLHPGVAARSFALCPDGRRLLLADRPAHCVRLYALDTTDGRPTQITETPVPDPACVVFVPLRED